MGNDRNKSVHQKTSYPFFYITLFITVTEFYKYISGTGQCKSPAFFQAFYHIHTGMQFTAQIKLQVTLSDLDGFSSQLHKLSCYNIHMWLKHFISKMGCQYYMSHAFFIFFTQHPQGFFHIPCAIIYPWQNMAMNIIKSFHQNNPFISLSSISVFSLVAIIQSCHLLRKVFIILLSYVKIDPRQ